MVPALAKLLQEACAKLDLPPWVVEGRASGSLSILVGMACLDPDILPARWLPTQTNRAYSIRPRRSLNPVGFLLSLNPLQSPEQTLSIAMDIGLKEALSIPWAFRGPFQELVAQQFEHAKQLLHNHRSEINGTNEIRPALLEHFRQCWRVLETQQLSGRTLVERTQSARREVEQKYQLLSTESGRKRKTPVFTVNPDQDRVSKRGSHPLWNRLINLGKNQEIREKRAKRLLSRHGPDYEEFQEVPYDQTGTKRAGKWLGKGLKAQAANYPCALGIPGDLGRAELCHIITTVARLETDSDVILACCIFGFCRHRDVRFGKFYQLASAIPSLKTKIKVPHHRPQAAKDLYRPRSHWLVRPLPKNLAERLLDLRRNWTKRFLPALEGAEARLIQICPTATYAKFFQAYLVHGESWFGLPWSLIESALNSQKSKFPAPRSYTHVSAQIIRKSEPFLKVIDPTFAMPTHDWWEGTGSALVPTTPTIQQLMTAWQEYLTQPLVAEIEDLIPQWNAVAAGMHLTVLLLCGLRNHPMDGVPLEFLYTRDWGLVQQKGEPFAFYVAPVLRQLLQRTRDRWNQVVSELKRFNLTLCNDQSSTYAYGFLHCDRSLARSGHLEYFTPDHCRIAEAFLSQPSLAPYARLDRKWGRHFSNTVLREAGFSEISVRSFHGHADYMLHSFRRHRLEPLIARSDLDLMVDCLAHEIGLIP